MIRLLPLILLLAACGVDGDPLTPDEAEEQRRGPGITVTGSVGVGVSGTL